MTRREAFDAIKEIPADHRISILKKHPGWTFQLPALQSDPWWEIPAMQGNTPGEYASAFAEACLKDVAQYLYSGLIEG